MQVQNLLQCLCTAVGILKNILPGHLKKSKYYPYTSLLPIFVEKQKLPRFSAFNLSFQYAVPDSGLSQVP